MVIDTREDSNVEGGSFILPFTLGLLIGALLLFVVETIDSQRKGGSNAKPAQ